MSNANHFKENFSQFVSRLKDNYESITWRLQDTRDVEWNKRGRGGIAKLFKLCKLLCLILGDFMNDIFRWDLPKIKNKNIITFPINVSVF